VGGSNQMIFLITALFVGQGVILGQGSAAVPLLITGVLLGWAAAPAWTELVLMWPNRVGGIAAACAEAYRPYNPVLSALTGTCYWWGWVPTCGVTALLSASAFQQWYFPGLPVEAVAIRTLSQLSDDGLLPRFLSWRIEATDCPWTATSLTAGSASIFLLVRCG
jgi:amino acid permease